MFEKRNLVFDSTDLLTSEIIGIDECGYHALLGDQGRVPFRRKTEFFKADGWKGINDEGVFFADILEDDNTSRDSSTTRQYLWSNAITKTRSGQSIPGTVYLRQGDYYFIRTIVSNHENKSANYRFLVTTPAGSLKDVNFSGNGDPSSDSVVGGNNGGNGIPLNKTKLCESVLVSALGGSQGINFAIIEDMQLVLNLTSLF